MAIIIDHDALFKQVLTELFVEFLDLFCPDALALLDREQIAFLGKELFADLSDPNRREADLVVRVGLRGQEAFFVIHLEHQAPEDPGLDRWMFRYFSRLYDREDVLIYLIALCLYTRPQRRAGDTHAAPSWHARRCDPGAPAHAQSSSACRTGRGAVRFP